MFDFSDLNNLHKKTLRLFCKEHKLKCTGTIDELAKIIEDAVSAGVVSIQSYNYWRIKVLREGRKHIYIFGLNKDSCVNLNSSESLSKLKAEKGLNDHDIINIDKPENPLLAYFRWTEINGVVQKIEMLFIEKKVLCIPNYQNGIIENREINYYIFVDINLDEKNLYIILEPTKGLREPGIEDGDLNVTASKVAQRYCSKVCELLNIETHDNREEYQGVLKELWNYVCSTDDPEINDKIESINDCTEAYINQCFEKLEINGDTDFVYAEELKSRINNYWYKILINQPLEEIDIVNNGVGYITKEKVRGSSSQNLTLASSKEIPIHMTDYHYDMKTAVDLDGHIVYMKFTWNGLEGIDKEIDTILEVFTGFFRIVFTGYSVEEEVEHVLSGIRRFKN